MCVHVFEFLCDEVCVCEWLSSCVRALLAFTFWLGSRWDNSIEKSACGRIKTDNTLQNMNSNDLYCFCTIVVRKSAPEAHLKDSNN